MSTKRAKQQDGGEFVTLVNIKADIAAKALVLYRETIPAKIELLGKKLESFGGDHNLLGGNGKEDGESTNKRAKVEAPEPYNEKQVLKDVCNAAETVKEEVEAFCMAIATLKVWVQLMIPRIEGWLCRGVRGGEQTLIFFFFFFFFFCFFLFRADGGNFGVSVQEDIVAELHRAEESSFQFLDQLTKYFLRRAKKRVKYPDIEEYALCIQESDAKTLTSYKLCLFDLRNQYLLLHDLIHKNYEKVTNPRSDKEVSAMY